MKFQMNKSNSKGILDPTNHQFKGLKSTYVKAEKIIRHNQTRTANDYHLIEIICFLCSIAVPIEVYNALHYVPLENH